MVCDCAVIIVACALVEARCSVLEADTMGAIVYDRHGNVSWW